MATCKYCLILTHNSKNLSIDFMTRLSKSKDWRGVEYNLILVIVDQLTKIVNYKPILTIINVDNQQGY